MLRCCLCTVVMSASTDNPVTKIMLSSPPASLRRERALTTLMRSNDKNVTKNVAPRLPLGESLDFLGVNSKIMIGNKQSVRERPIGNSAHSVLSRCFRILYGLAVRLEIPPKKRYNDVVPREQTDRSDDARIHHPSELALTYAHCERLSGDTIHHVMTDVLFMLNEIERLKPTKRERETMISENEEKTEMDDDGTESDDEGSSEEYTTDGVASDDEETDENSD